MFTKAPTEISNKFGLFRGNKSHNIAELFVGNCFLFSPWRIFVKSHNTSISKKNKSLARKIGTYLLLFLICILCFSVAGSSFASGALVCVDTDETGKESGNDTGRCAICSRGHI